MPEQLTHAVFRGLSAAVFSAVVIYIGLRAWVVLTVSVGPVGKLYSMIDVAVLLGAVSSFVTTAIASYTS